MISPSPQGHHASKLAQSGELRRTIGSHAGVLHHRALRLCRDETFARDLVQDTLERALRFESHYEPSSNLGAWLQRILLSVYFTHCRRRRRERSAVDLLLHDPCAWTSPEAPTGAQTLSAPAARALASLPAQFRLAVELVDVAELSYHDAAVVMGVPIGTVMSRLHRGRRMLADRWVLAGSASSALARAA